MASLPPPDNRVLMTVDALKKLIRSGEVHELLPGERELAARLSVSRKTLRKAMQTLTQERWISTPTQGRRRKILKDTSTTASQRSTPSLRGKAVVIMAPRPLLEMSSIEKFYQSNLGRLCGKSGITLRHRHLDVRHLKHPAHRLKEFTLQNPADLYLLQHSSHPIQHWFEKHSIPALVLGNLWEGVHLPNVDGDNEAAAVHLAALLQRNGHRNVAMLTPSPSKKGLENFANKLRQAAPEINLHSAPFEESPEATTGAAMRLLSERPCTAVITPTIYSTMAVISSAGQLGLRVPFDVSVICMSHDALFDYSTPTIAGYKYDWSRYAKLTFTAISNLLLHSETNQKVSSRLMPDFIPGGSIGKAEERS